MKKTLLICAVLSFSGIGSFPVFGEELLSFENALRETLANSPGVKIEHQAVVQQKGLLTSASGSFDWVASGMVSSEKTHAPVSMSKENYEEQIIYSLGIGKQLRNGIVVKSSVSASDYQDELTQTTPVNNSNLSAEVVIPLLKGRGEKNTAATELAARSNLTAAEQNTVQGISGQLMTTSDLYWQCLAQHEVLRLYEEAESRDAQLVRVVELLVEGGELPRANFEQAKAKHYKSSADVSGARLDFIKACYNLSAAMGRDPSAASPLPEGPFPEIIDENALDINRENDFVKLAMRNRGDYQASLTSINSEKILLQQSKNTLSPQLDLTIKGGYAGLVVDSERNRYIKALHDDLRGLNTYMALSLELPIRNRAAKGNVIYYRAQVDKAEQTSRSLSLSIVSEVKSATETLRQAIKKYQLARLSAASYKIAVDDEYRNVKMGQSNLTSLIDMQDRYLEVRLSEKQALMQYTMALTELRYVTGSVFSGAGDEIVLDTAKLLTLPAVE